MGTKKVKRADKETTVTWTIKNKHGLHGRVTTCIWNLKLTLPLLSSPLPNPALTGQLFEQNNNSAHASRSFVHFLAVPAQLPREMTKVWVDLRTGSARR